MFELPVDLSISNAMQLLKVESTFWANKEKLFSSKLEWADEYFAPSVSESNLEKVKTYIQTQDEHHAKVTSQQEYDKFIQQYQFK